MKLRPFLAACAVLGSFSLLPAPAYSLDLLQAYQAALGEDARIRAARASRDAAIERLPQARAQLLPNVSIGLVRNKNDIERTERNLLGRKTRTDEEYFSYNQSLQLRQPLFHMPLYAGLNQARHVVEDAEAVLELELQELGARVTAAYLEALLAEESLALANKQTELTTTQLDAARKSFAAGVGTRTDIDEAQARLDLNTAEVLSAGHQLDFSRRQLAILINQPVSELAAIDPQRLPLQPLAPVEVEDWIALAEANSPHLRALQARAQAAAAEVKRARGGHYPTVDAVAALTRSGSENANSPNSSHHNRMIGIQVNIPLFAGGYTSSTVRQAAAEQIRADENLLAARRELAIEVQREHRGVVEGIARVRALEQALHSAQQVVLSTRRSFAAGSRTTIDVLNAEQQQQHTARELAEARHLYLLSHVRLHAVAGLDRQASIDQANSWLQGASEAR